MCSVSTPVCSDSRLEWSQEMQHGPAHPETLQIDDIFDCELILGHQVFRHLLLLPFLVIAHFISWNPYEVTAHSLISYGLRWEKAQQQYLLGSSEDWGSDPSIHSASWALANVKAGRDKRMACLSLLTLSLSSRCYHKVQGEILPQRSRQRMVEEDTQLLWEGRLLVASCLAPK